MALYGKFGELDSADQLNELAGNLLKEGDKGSIGTLAEENGIPVDYVQMFIVGDIPVICDISTAAIGKMKAVGIKYKGKHYDTLFQWSDSKMYCSELIWKIYSQGADIELCPPEQFSDFPISNPVVKKLIKERYGDKFDPSEQIVSPHALFKSRLLKEVRYSEL